MSLPLPPLAMSHEPSSMHQASSIRHQASIINNRKFGPTGEPLDSGRRVNKGQMRLPQYCFIFIHVLNNDNRRWISLPLKVPACGLEFKWHEKWIPAYGLRVQVARFIAQFSKRKLSSFLCDALCARKPSYT